MKIKANERVFPVDEGIDFLGYVIYPDHVLLRKRIKQKFARKCTRLNRKEEACLDSKFLRNGKTRRLYNVVQ